MLMLNSVLALGWAAVTGSLTLPNLVAGFAIGFATLWLTRPLYGDTRYFVRIRRVCGLAVFFVDDLMRSSLRVLHDVFTPRLRARPGIVAVPLDAETDTAILLVANLITLTPGTLSMDVSDDRKTLYVHAMYIDDIDRVRAALKRGTEAKVLEALR
ncbi:MAG: hypothetical protein GC191_18340 [Azospirillum sp.]|nr:hypothetical protein [Azospirillum sp.]